MKTLIAAALIAACLVPTSAAVAAAGQAPPCRAAQLRLSVDDHSGDFDGMSHAGAALWIRNVGRDCMLAGLPLVQFRDARGRVLDARRTPPLGMHPGPVVLPVRLSASHPAATALRWVSGPVFDQSRSVRAASVGVAINGQVVRTPLRARLFGEGAKPVGFDQAPLHSVEGLAAH